MDLGNLISGAGDLMSGGLFGAVTGIIGSGVTAYTNFKMQKMKNEHEVAMAAEDRETMKLESQLAIQKEEVKIEGEVELAEVGALTESYKQAQKELFDREYMKSLPRCVSATIAFLFAIVDFLKGLARPLLTYYLMAASTVLTIMSYKAYLSFESENSELWAKVFWQLVTTIIFLTVSSVTWWFCDRRMAKFLMRLNDGNMKKV